MRCGGEVMSIENSREYQLGAMREEQWLKHLATTGCHSFPAYGATNVSDDTKAPLVWTPDGKKVAADVMAIAEDGYAMWCEVKAKAIPNYMWKMEHRGWWHGVDKYLFADHYQALSEKAESFWIVICESHYPPSNDYQPPSDAYRDPDAIKFSLEQGPNWLTVKYEKAKNSADSRTVKHLFGSGNHAWVWRRDIMTPIKSINEKEVNFA